MLNIGLLNPGICIRLINFCQSNLEFVSEHWISWLFPGACLYIDRNTENSRADFIILVSSEWNRSKWKLSSLSLVRRWSSWRIVCSRLFFLNVTRMYWWHICKRRSVLVNLSNPLSTKKHLNAPLLSKTTKLK